MADPADHVEGELVEVGEGADGRVLPFFQIAVERPHVFAQPWCADREEVEPHRELVTGIGREPLLRLLLPV
ncbi:MAG: hypothetical protein WCC48_04560 [Anaeromyxobacteraceae bacterium]